jgi:hypothetical protein
MNELFGLIEDQKSEEVVRKIENHIESDSEFQNDLKRMKEKWKDYEMGLFLKIHTVERIIEFQKNDLTKFLDLTKLDIIESNKPKSVIASTITEPLKSRELSQRNKVSSQGIIDSRQQITDKQYARNQVISILYLILGVGAFLNLLVGYYSITYQLLRSSLGLLFIISGIWSILVPYATIKKDSIIIRHDIFKSLSIRFEDIKEIEDNSSFVRITLNDTNSKRIKKRFLSKNCRFEIYNDLKGLIIK